MIDINQIKIVHVEASSRCNSHCPMCSRYTNNGFLQPDLIEEDLSSDIFFKLFTKNFTQQLEHVYFSGVYGDPCLNKLLPEFVSYLLDHGCKSISIDTNGGYRNEAWWASLARSGVLINFAIDGLGDVLGKYRIGVNYDKVYKNLLAYHNAGGLAQWNFIVFAHNEHQVEDAIKLASDLGIKFRLKVTQKFRGKKNYKVLIKGQQMSVLEPPIQEKYRHTNIGLAEHIPFVSFSFDIKKYSALNNNIIKCKSLERKEIYLSSSGLLMPCCYLGTHTHDSPGAWNFNQNYNLEDYNLKNHSVENVISKLYKISDKWGSTLEEGNLITCLNTCGQKENTTLYYSETLNKENILKDRRC